MLTATDTNESFNRACAEMDFRSAKRYTRISFECLATREFTEYAFWRSIALRLLHAAITWRDGNEPAVIERSPIPAHNPRTAQKRVARRNTRWANGESIPVDDTGADVEPVTITEPIPMPVTNGRLLGMFGLKVASAAAPTMASEPVTVHTSTVMDLTTTPPTIEVKKFSLSLAFRKTK